MAEAAEWHDILAIDDTTAHPVEPLVQAYYDRHPGAPRHDDPPHRRAAPPRHCTICRR